MAKLSDLIEVFASALSVPQTTVEAYVKVLRKSGLLTTGGRGRGAPDITSKDCASVLLAMMSGSPTHAVEMLSGLGSLRCAIVKSQLDESDVPSLSVLGLKKDHHFLEAITALIDLSATRNPMDAAMEVALSTIESDEERIDTFGHGRIQICHQTMESFIFFGAQWLVRTGENTAKSDSTETWLVYWPDYQIDAQGYNIPSINFETKTSVKLYAIDEIGAMLSS